LLLQHGAVNEPRALELRLLADPPSNASRPFPQTGSSDPILLEEKLLLDDTALKGASVRSLPVAPQGQHLVEAELTEDGVQRVVQISRQFARRKVALVIFGVVYGYGPPNWILQNGKLVICSTLPEPEATNLVARINHRLENPL